MAFKDIFGFSFKKDKQESQQKDNEFGGLEPPKSQPSFVAPEDYDGTFVVEGGGFFSQYFEVVKKRCTGQQRGWQRENICLAVCCKNKHEIKRCQHHQCT